MIHFTDCIGIGVWSELDDPYHIFRRDMKLLMCTQHSELSFMVIDIHATHLML